MAVFTHGLHGSETLRTLIKFGNVCRRNIMARLFCFCLYIVRFLSHRSDSPL